MSWWMPLAIGYGIAFVTSPIAYPDGPEPGWFSASVVFGTILAAAGEIGLLIA